MPDFEREDDWWRNGQNRNIRNRIIHRLLQNIRCDAGASYQAYAGVEPRDLDNILKAPLDALTQMRRWCVLSGLRRGRTGESADEWFVR
ncbi:hypothetical protein [Escherichia coli]|uniref:hypothetical protein n=1 Tax=Escherichia coli TaxID=562 RepID=UPI00399F77A0